FAMADEAESGEELIVDLEDKPEKVEPAKVEAKPPPVPGPPPAEPTSSQAGLLELEKQIENERRARAQATDTARRLAQERDHAGAYAQEAERRGVSAYEVYADNQIASVVEQMDTLTAQQESAYNDGDWKTVSQINQRLNRLGGQLAVMERDKAFAAQQR